MYRNLHILLQSLKLKKRLETLFLSSIWVVWVRPRLRRTKNILKEGKSLRRFFLHLSSLSWTPVWRLVKAQCIPTRTTVPLSHGYYKTLPYFSHITICPILNCPITIHTFILSKVWLSHGDYKPLIFILSKVWLSHGLIYRNLSFLLFFLHHK